MSTPAYVQAVGYAVATLVSVASAPQIVKTLRTKSAGDVAWLFPGIYSAGNLLGVAYGILLPAYPVVLSSALGAVGNGVILVVKARTGRRREAVDQPASYAVSLAAADPHHVGLVVPDLDAACEWLSRAFGVSLLVVEPETDVPGQALGLPGQAVRLRGALLGSAPSSKATVIEVHEFGRPATAPGQRRAHDGGLSHLAWRATDIHADMARLAVLGVQWHLPDPLLITDGPYTGRRWVYGFVQELQATIELLQEPEPVR